MPEGHTIRYMANMHENLFRDSIVSAESPQGRFADEAKRITGNALTGTSTHGKHLFLHFGSDVVHVHLGLYGWFHFFRGGEGSKRDSVRLRLNNGLYASELTGPTRCELISEADTAHITEELGQDPLHENADPDEAWAIIQKSRKPIATLLMDQGVIAGIGNVYRAELLYIARQDPFLIGADLERKVFDNIWSNAVRLLRKDAETGFIQTVDLSEFSDEDRANVGKYTNTVYVYKRHGQPCFMCNTPIKTMRLAGRALYWCPTCQK